MPAQYHYAGIGPGIRPPGASRRPPPPFHPWERPPHGSSMPHNHAHPIPGQAGPYPLAPRARLGNRQPQAQSTHHVINQRGQQSTNGNAVSSRTAAACTRSRPVQSSAPRHHQEQFLDPDPDQRAPLRSMHPAAGHGHGAGTGLGREHHGSIGTGNRLATPATYIPRRPSRSIPPRPVPAAGVVDTAPRRGPYNQAGQSHNHPGPSRGMGDYDDDLDAGQREELMIQMQEEFDHEGDLDDDDDDHIEDARKRMEYGPVIEMPVPDEGVDYRLTSTVPKEFRADKNRNMHLIMGCAPSEVRSKKRDIHDMFRYRYGFRVKKAFSKYSEYTQNQMLCTVQWEFRAEQWEYWRIKAILQTMCEDAYRNRRNKWRISVKEKMRQLAKARKRQAKAGAIGQSRQPQRAQHTQQQALQRPSHNSNQQSTQQNLDPRLRQRYPVHTTSGVPLRSTQAQPNQPPSLGTGGSGVASNRPDSRGQVQPNPRPPHRPAPAGIPTGRGYPIRQLLRPHEQQQQPQLGQMRHQPQSFRQPEQVHQVYQDGQPEFDYDHRAYPATAPAGRIRAETRPNKPMSRHAEADHTTRQWLEQSPLGNQEAERIRQTQMQGHGDSWTPEQGQGDNRIHSREYTDAYQDSHGHHREQEGPDGFQYHGYEEHGRAVGDDGGGVDGYNHEEYDRDDYDNRGQAPNQGHGDDSRGGHGPDDMHDFTEEEIREMEEEEARGYVHAGSGTMVVGTNKHVQRKGPQLGYARAPHTTGGATRVDFQIGRGVPVPHETGPASRARYSPYPAPESRPSAASRQRSPPADHGTARRPGLHTRQPPNTSYPHNRQGVATAPWNDHSHRETGSAGAGRGSGGHEQGHSQHANFGEDDEANFNWGQDTWNPPPIRTSYRANQERREEAPQPSQTLSAIMSRRGRHTAGYAGVSNHGQTEMGSSIGEPRRAIPTNTAERERREDAPHPTQTHHQRPQGIARGDVAINSYRTRNVQGTNTNRVGRLQQPASSSSVPVPAPRPVGASNPALLAQARRANVQFPASLATVPTSDVNWAPPVIQTRSGRVVPRTPAGRELARATENDRRSGVKWKLVKRAQATRTAANRDWVDNRSGQGPWNGRDE
ncbi:hypothetical protein BJ508DRAFT_336359 [Ascobolus immersus RN42]|uniref:Uncharacterized protein n=1 Tax=Ascobolus immersus RN42 TaxID=1160509 RepID=A0A3N4HCW8_ASCIM|nr:hypothetical protein BJ508DRAFT_336359 [Ascobolus immersus RN42]